MKAIAVYKNVNIHEVENWWRQEHQGYYAKNLFPLGFFDFADGSVKSKELGNRIAKDFDLDLYGRAHTYAWLTGGNNLTVVIQEKDHVKVLFDGRRHGVRKPFDNDKLVEWTYLSTWLPEDCPPYLNRDAYASQSLECWKKVEHTFGENAFDKERILLEHVGQDSDMLMSLSELIQWYLDIGSSRYATYYLGDVWEGITEDIEAHLNVRGFKEELRLLEVLKEAEGEELVSRSMLLDLSEQVGVTASSIVYTTDEEINNPFKDVLG
jgi:hypothetical protein